jgi:hypothetical protein
MSGTVIVYPAIDCASVHTMKGIHTIQVNVPNGRKKSEHPRLLDVDSDILRMVIDRPSSTGKHTRTEKMRFLFRLSERAMGSQEDDQR